MTDLDIKTEHYNLDWWFTKLPLDRKRAIRKKYSGRSKIEDTEVKKVLKFPCHVLTVLLILCALPAVFIVALTMDIVSGFESKKS